MHAVTSRIVLDGKRGTVDFGARCSVEANPTPAAVLLSHASRLGFSPRTQILRASLCEVRTAPFQDNVSAWSDDVASYSRSYGGQGGRYPLKLVACPTDPAVKVNPLRF